MRLRGSHVEIRSLESGDRPLLVQLGADATVLRWWPELPDEIDDVLSGTDGATSFVVETDGQQAGIIQYWEESTPGYRHAGIDIVLAAPFQHRGLGTDAVTIMARHLFDDLNHHRLTIDPAADNKPAIRCYKRVGFRPVGIMRQYELLPDATHRDALLLDLLRTEFRS